MTTREFMQHILLNADLDDPVEIEVRVPAGANPGELVFVQPTHVTKIGGDSYEQTTLVETKPFKEDN